ncbi:MAG: lamin tail domain-containing protein [Verrucomicrobia bacterium]|nr:lamin tail domain-containing protein [Verrucomicrobiota bacterium]
MRKTAVYLAMLVIPLQGFAQLKINEVYYNVTPQGGNQFVELYNAASSNLYLDGLIITDEAGTGVEGIYKFPGDPGETNYPVTPGEYVMIAVDAKDATSNAHWECYAQGADSDNPLVPNLELVSGVTDLALYGNGDNLILADGTDTNAPIDHSTIIDGMNYGGGGGELAPLSSSAPDTDPSVIASSNFSLGRCPDGWDLDAASSYDFIELSPTPGAANACETPVFSVQDVSLNEGDSGTSEAMFTVTLLPAPTQNVSVTLSTADGTATAGSDYTAVAATALVFTAGVTQQTFDVSILGDTQTSTNEIFYLNLSNPTNGMITDSQAVCTILNDDGISMFSINDSSILEGDSGTVNMPFAVSLSPPSELTARVTYSTSNGTASAGADFTGIGGLPLQFTAGVTSQTFSISVIGDTTDTADESFYVHLSGPTNAAIDDGDGIGTIIDDDGIPIVSVSDTNIMEGDSGTTNVVFIITLNRTNDSATSINFATSDGTAEAGQDYVAVAATTLVFSAGISTQIVEVDVLGDTLASGDEIFYAVLSSPTNLLLLDNQGACTIINDDGTSSVVIANVNINEGNTGTSNMVFAVTMSAENESDASVNYLTQDGSAKAGSDYIAIGETALIIPAGETVTSITVQAVSDALASPHEYMVVNLVNPTNTTIADSQASGWIFNDDGSSAFSINDSSVDEGDSGTTNLPFTITLSPGNEDETSVVFASSNGTALAGSDYTAVAPTTVLFSAGTLNAVVDVEVLGDTDIEANKTFFGLLSSPVNASISDAQGVATILDDDAGATVSVSDASALEGNAGTTGLTFMITLSEPAGGGESINFSTDDDTALAGSDYTSIATTTLVFSGGSTAVAVEVTAFGDTAASEDETFFLNLSSPTGLVVGDSLATGTIINDDGTSSVSIADASLPEGDAGTADMTFTSTLSVANENDVSINYATSDGSASSGTDYTGVSSSLVFTAGATSETFFISIIGDELATTNESFTIDLSSPTNALIDDGQATGTIINDDGTSSVSIADNAMLEGDSGTANLSFALEILPAAEDSASVTYSTADNTALAGTDYVAIVSTPYVFAAGDTSGVINVAVMGDGTEESPETFFVNLTSPTNAVIADGQATGGITDDDDNMFTLSIDYNLPGNIATVNWDSVVAETYYIQFSTNLYSGIWSNLTSLTAVGPTSTAVDATGSVTSRYYRGLRE